MLLTQLFQELYNAADCAMLGYFGEMNALAASGIAGALLSAAGYFAAGPLMVLLQCPAEVVAPASTYLRICACGIMAQLFYNVAAAVLRSLGDSIGPMICTLLCYAVFRVAWCLLLIPVFETMHIVYFSCDVSFFLMFILLLPAYRRLLNGRND